MREVVIKAKKSLNLRIEEIQLSISELNFNMDRIIANASSIQKEIEKTMQAIAYVTAIQKETKVLVEKMISVVSIDMLLTNLRDVDLKVVSSLIYCFLLSLLFKKFNHI